MDNIKSQFLKAKSLRVTQSNIAKKWYTDELFDNIVCGITGSPNNPNTSVATPLDETIEKVKDTRLEKANENYKSRITKTNNILANKDPLKIDLIVVQPVHTTDSQIVTYYKCKLCNQDIKSEVVTTKCFDGCKYKFHSDCWSDIVYDNTARCPSDTCNTYVRTYICNNIKYSLDKPKTCTDTIDYEIKLVPSVVEFTKQETKVDIVVNSLIEEDNSIDKYELMSHEYKSNKFYKESVKHERKLRKIEKANEKINNQNSLVTKLKETSIKTIPSESTPPEKVESVWVTRHLDTISSSVQTTLVKEEYTYEPKQDNVESLVNDLIETAIINAEVTSAKQEDVTPLVLSKDVTSLVVNEDVTKQKKYGKKRGVKKKIEPVHRVYQRYNDTVYMCYSYKHIPANIVNFPCNHITYCNYCIGNAKMCLQCYGTIISINYL